MTTLSLTHVSFAPVSDLSVVTLVAQTAESVDIQTPTTVRRYAGGRDRIVTTPGETTVVTMSFSYMTRADYFALEDLLGQLVLVRDQRGRVIAGTMAGVTSTEWIVADKVEGVNVSISSASYSEIA